MTNNMLGIERQGYIERCEAYYGMTNVTLFGTSSPRENKNCLRQLQIPRPKLLL